jgi:putative FmdB family regulatory protein
MPIYEFVCEACGRIVERLQKLSDPPPEACPECGGKMAKIMSRNSFQLKGGGWYRDLYGSGGGTTSSRGEPTTAKEGTKNEEGGKKEEGTKKEEGPAKKEGAPAATPAAAPKESKKNDAT